MAAIITEKFRLHNADQFEESFTESSNNTYYLFIGKSMPFTSGTSGGSDSSPPTPTDGPTEEFYAWDSMTAAKKIASPGLAPTVAAIALCSVSERFLATGPPKVESYKLVAPYVAVTEAL